MISFGDMWDLFPKVTGLEISNVWYDVAGESNTATHDQMLAISARLYALSEGRDGRGPAGVDNLRQGY